MGQIPTYCWQIKIKYLQQSFSCTEREVGTESQMTKYQQKNPQRLKNWIALFELGFGWSQAAGKAPDPILTCKK